MNAAQAKARAGLLKALAHPTRVLMLEALSRGDCCVNDLRSLATTSQPTISRHLDKLKKVGIVTERRAGKKVIHHLATPCMMQALSCTLEALQSVKKRQDQSI
jgi:DNA-binding transcriptional ArsR family regulator